MSKTNAIILSIVLIIIFSAVSCTQNSRAKSWGGQAEITLPKGEKLITATWKDSDLWYLTREMREDEVAEEYTFHEESSLGMMEGTYVIKEVK